jgi:hypothetical protein
MRAATQESDASSYGDTYAPTANMVSIKIFLQLAASRGLIIRSLDVGGAYLHADIDREIHLQIPSVEPGDPVRIARLRKSLYGLRQADIVHSDALLAHLRSVYGEVSYNDGSSHLGLSHHGHSARTESGYSRERHSYSGWSRERYS